MPYYREKEHLLGLPSKASIPNFTIIESNQSGVFSVNTVPPISVKWLDTIKGDLKQIKIYLSKSNKIRQNIKLFNESIMDNSENTNEQLDIDSWFDEDAESSMIFIFLSCIIALLAFILLVFLCFKHEKLRKLISLYMASTQVVNAAALDSTCNTGNIFQYLLFAICILILLYAIVKMIIRGSQYFRRYQTTTHFMCQQEHDKEPSTAIALELSTMSEITHVHIAHLNIPITRLSVNETDHNAYYLVSGNRFYDFIKLSQPIILLIRDGVIPIPTPVTFEVGFFQSQKLKRILHTDYLVRVVAFQNGYMIPLSRIQVCHSSRIVTPVRTLLATQSRPERVAASGGLYPSHQLAKFVELSIIVISSLTNPSSYNITPTQTPTAPNISQVVWGS